MFALIAIGMPVAYALGAAALVGAVWIDIPWDTVYERTAPGEEMATERSSARAARSQARAVW